MQDKTKLPHAVPNLCISLYLQSSWLTAPHPYHATARKQVLDLCHFQRGERALPACFAMHAAPLYAQICPPDTHVHMLHPNHPLPLVFTQAKHLGAFDYDTQSSDP